MKTVKRLTAVVLCLALALGLAACKGTDGGKDGKETTKQNGGNTAYDLSQTGDYTAENTKYLIGATGPLTGDVASYGISVQNGASLAVEEINSAGGLNGVNFDFLMLDDKAAAADASNGYDTLFEKGMQVSLGSVTSASCESFASRANEDELFFLTPSASAQSIIDSSPFAFRVCFGDPDQGVLAAQKLAAEYEKIGTIYDSSDPYSEGIYRAFKAEMETLGKEYIEQSFDKDNNRDFSTQVEALKDCETIFMPIYYTEAGLIAKACVAKGCKAMLFGCDGFDGVRGQIDASVLANNKVKYITPFDAEATDEQAVSFVTAYKAKYDNAVPDQFAADAYDAVYIIFNAMKAAGVDNVKVSPSELGKALVAAVTDAGFSYKGLTGDMTWEESGSCKKTPNIVELD